MGFCVKMGHSSDFVEMVFSFTPGGGSKSSPLTRGFCPFIGGISRPPFISFGHYNFSVNLVTDRYV